CWKRSLPTRRPSTPARSCHACAGRNRLDPAEKGGRLHGRRLANLDLAQRDHREIVEQPLELRPDRRQSRIVTDALAPRDEVRPGMLRIELPRVEVEANGTPPRILPPGEKADHRIWQRTEIEAPGEWQV